MNSGQALAIADYFFQFWLGIMPLLFGAWLVKRLIFD